MAILRRKCISLFREYQIFPNQKQKGSRESKLMKILFSQYVSAEISYTIYILIFRYDWQGHRKQIREIKCASCLHKTKCYSQGRDRLRLKLASSPQVKELLGGNSHKLLTQAFFSLSSIVFLDICHILFPICILFYVTLVLQ